jgi:hypothetical protein
MNNREKAYLPFFVARKAIRILGIKSQSEWSYYSKNNRPSNIPSTPQRSYKNRGWSGWKDWLGYEERISSRRKYKVNHDFFKKWSYDMAYILGFWFADGWIRNNRFGIIQHKKDKYLLEQILKTMQSDNILHKNRSSNCYSIEINSIEIVKDIKKLGGKERKSLDVKFPKIPTKYLPDFIRGLWDGDGCISYSKTVGKECYKSSYVCGSKDFVDTMFALLKMKIYGLNGIIYKNNRGIFTIMFGKNDTIRLRDYIYGKGKSNIKLLRKFDKFNDAGEICKIGREKKDFLRYVDAKNVIKNIGLHSVSEWYGYSKARRPSNIPSTPMQYYKDKGWTNWYDWLGKRVGAKEK